MARVLLVEDNEMNRDMLSRRLTKAGHSVTMAFDGAQGVEMARGGGHDIILMDMSLPVIDGWEATRQIRASDGLGQIPIIALTAHAMAGDREKAMTIFRKIVAGNQWASFGYIAAEAELKR